MAQTIDAIIISFGQRSETTGTGFEESSLLKAKLAEAQRELDALRKENKVLQAELVQFQSNKTSSNSSSTSATSQVFDVIRSLRKLIQRAYHPDQCREMRAPMAHERFVSVMSALERIDKLRT